MCPSVLGGESVKILLLVLSTSFVSSASACGRLAAGTLPAELRLT